MVQSDSSKFRSRHGVWAVRWFFAGLIAWNLQGLPLALGQSPEAEIQLMRDGTVYSFYLNSGLLKTINSPSAAGIDLSPRQRKQINALASETKQIAIDLLNESAEKKWSIKQIRKKVSEIVLKQEEEIKKVLVPAQVKQLMRTKKLREIYFHGIAELLIRGKTFGKSKGLKGEAKEKFLRKARKVAKRLKEKIYQLEKEAYDTLLEEMPKDVKHDVMETLALRNHIPQLQMMVLLLERTTNGSTDQKKGVLLGPRRY